MFTFESPHRGDSNEYIQYTIFNMNKKNTLNLSKICSYGLFSKGLKNKFETAVINEPSMFEPLKFYCIVSKKLLRLSKITIHWTYHRLYPQYFITYNKISML